MTTNHLVLAACIFYTLVVAIEAINYLIILL